MAMKTDAANDGAVSTDDEVLIAGADAVEAAFQSWPKGAVQSFLDKGAVMKEDFEAAGFEMFPTEELANLMQEIPQQLLSTWPDFSREVASLERRGTEQIYGTVAAKMLDDVTYLCESVLNYHEHRRVTAVSSGSSATTAPATSSLLPHWCRGEDFKGICEHCGGKRRGFGGGYCPSCVVAKRHAQGQR